MYATICSGFGALLPSLNTGRAAYAQWNHNGTSMEHRQRTAHARWGLIGTLVARTALIGSRSLSATDWSWRLGPGGGKRGASTSFDIHGGHWVLSELLIAIRYFHGVSLGMYEGLLHIHGICLGMRDIVLTELRRVASLCVIICVMNHDGQELVARVITCVALLC